MNFSRSELADLRAAMDRGDPPRCPRCRVELERQPVARRPPVSYVRDRVWYRCPSCARSAVLDR